MLPMLPVLIPLIAASVCLALWRWPRTQAFLGVMSNGGMVAAAIVLLGEVRGGEILVVEVGGWAAPAGIALVADLFASVMVLLASIVTLAVSVSSLSRARDTGGCYFPLLLLLDAAVSGAFLSGDLFNLYVWFELMLLSSFVLLTLGGERRALEGAIKYVTLNLISSVLFLASLGLIYGALGTLSMADLALRLDSLDAPPLATALATPLLIAFAVKAAVFPLYFWLPASYHTAPPVVTALFAGLLTKVGVYAIIRVLTLMFDQEWVLIGDIVLVAAGVTMVSGVLGAIAQSDVRRILSFHIVSQIGYMLMGLGVALSVLGAANEQTFTSAPIAQLALAGSVFYIVHHIIVKTNLFLISGAVLNARGTTELDELGGLSQTHRGLSAVFLVSALALAGVPILSGFWAKLALVRGGLEANAYVIVGVSLFVSVLTLFSMMKIWIGAFWGHPPKDTADALSWKRSFPAGAPIAALAALTVLIGLCGGSVFRLAQDTASQLLDSTRYIDSVLPGPTRLVTLDDDGGHP